MRTAQAAGALDSPALHRAADDGIPFLIPGFWIGRLSYTMLVWDGRGSSGRAARRHAPACAASSAARGWSNAPALDSQTEIELTIENDGHTYPRLPSYWTTLPAARWPIRRSTD